MPALLAITEGTVDGEDPSAGPAALDIDRLVLQEITHDLVFGPGPLSRHPGFVQDLAKPV